VRENEREEEKEEEEENKLFQNATNYKKYIYFVVSF
jgi:hypothetical protein